MLKSLCIALTIGWSLLFIGIPPIISQEKITPENKLNIFENLLDKTWNAEGQWGDGSPFKQEITFYKKLKGQLIIAESFGFVNEAKTEWGPRNFGIRKWDTKSEIITFTEHDSFGGITQGTVTSNKNDDIIYTYTYEGMTLTDYWQKLSNSKYKFTVGVYEDGTFKQVFLDTFMISNE